MSEVLRRVEQGEHVTITVDRRPVATIVPSRRGPVSMTVAREIAVRHRSDARLRADVRSVVDDTTADL